MGYTPHAGATLSVAGSELADVISITPPAWSREAVATHSLNSTAATFRPSRITDYGEAEVSIQYNKTAHATLHSYSNNYSSDVAIAISFYDGTTPSGQTCSFNGFLTNFEPGEANRDDTDNLEATVTIKVNGSGVWS